MTDATVAITAMGHGAEIAEYDLVAGQRGASRRARQLTQATFQIGDAEPGQTRLRRADQIA